MAAKIPAQEHCDRVDKYSDQMRESQVKTKQMQKQLSDYEQKCAEVTLSQKRTHNTITGCEQTSAINSDATTDESKRPRLSVMLKVEDEKKVQTTSSSSANDADNNRQMIDLLTNSYQQQLSMVQDELLNTCRLLSNAEKNAQDATNLLDKEKVISRQQHELIRKYIQRNKEKEAKIDELAKNLQLTTKILNKCRDDFRKVNAEAILKSSQVEALSCELKNTKIEKRLQLQQLDESWKKKCGEIRKTVRRSHADDGRATIIHQLETKLGEFLASLDAIKGERNKLAIQLTITNNQLRQKTGEIDSLSDTNEKILRENEAKCMKLQETIDRLRIEYIDQLESERCRYNQLKAENDDETSRLRIQLTDIMSKCRSISANNDRVIESIDKVNDYRSKLSIRLASVEAQNDQLAIEIETTKRDESLKRNELTRKYERIEQQLVNAFTIAQLNVIMKPFIDRMNLNQSTNTDDKNEYIIHLESILSSIEQRNRILESNADSFAMRAKIEAAKRHDAQKMARRIESRLEKAMSIKNIIGFDLESERNKSKSLQERVLQIDNELRSMTDMLNQIQRKIDEEQKSFKSRIQSVEQEKSRIYDIYNETVLELSRTKKSYQEVLKNTNIATSSANGTIVNLNVPFISENGTTIRASNQPPTANCHISPDHHQSTFATIFHDYGCMQTRLEQVVFERTFLQNRVDELHSWLSTEHMEKGDIKQRFDQLYLIADRKDHELIDARQQLAKLHQQLMSEMNYKK